MEVENNYEEQILGIYLPFHQNITIKQIHTIGLFIQFDYSLDCDGIFDYFPARNTTFKF